MIGANSHDGLVGVQCAIDRLASRFPPGHFLL
jgi:hypothetical protein